jgi:Heavy metal associated domain 2
MYYIHNVPGRVRIISDVLKRNAGAADEIRNALSTIRGIGTVNINLTIGSILIFYYAEITNCENIVRVLENMGYFDRSKAITNDEYVRANASKVAESLLRSITGDFVERTLG